MAESFPFVYISKNSGNGAVKRELPENPVVFKTNSLRKPWVSAVCLMSQDLRKAFELNT
ncbi:hypothetical protein P9C02_02000 [Bacillus paralicheniformis]|uniref:hypothetical protein n=1 Tax=Bacillus paralicheniformis TaxID=1648923 RepID=UPI002DBD7800|nr:hypothetical protein [Bacillus paralicheniformis]MEC1189301.1 hypothetical protein [Bacillus paralicheniformis]